MRTVIDKQLAAVPCARRESAMRTVIDKQLAACALVGGASGMVSESVLTGGPHRRWRRGSWMIMMLLAGAVAGRVLKRSGKTSGGERCGLRFRR